MQEDIVAITFTLSLPPGQFLPESLSLKERKNPRGSPDSLGYLLDWHDSCLKLDPEDSLELESRQNYRRLTMSEAGQIDAKRMFDYIVEEVRKIDLRDLSFDYSDAYLINGFGSFLSGADTETVPTLIIRDHIHEMEITVINYASMYQIRSEGRWQDKYFQGMEKVLSGENDLYEASLQEARLKLFSSSIRQAMSEAKTRYFDELANA